MFRKGKEEDSNPAEGIASGSSSMSSLVKASRDDYSHQKAVGASKKIYNWGEKLSLKMYFKKMEQKQTGA